MTGGFWSSLNEKERKNTTTITAMSIDGILVVVTSGVTCNAYKSLVLLFQKKSFWMSLMYVIYTACSYFAIQFEIVCQSFKRQQKDMWKYYSDKLPFSLINTLLKWGYKNITEVSVAWSCISLAIPKSQCGDIFHAQITSILCWAQWQSCHKENLFF